MKRLWAIPAMLVCSVAIGQDICATSCEIEMKRCKNLSVVKCPKTSYADYMNCGLDPQSGCKERLAAAEDEASRCRSANKVAAEDCQLQSQQCSLQCSQASSTFIPAQSGGPSDDR